MDASLVTRCLEATAVLVLWMTSNHLCPNSDKPWFIWLGRRTQLAKIDMESLLRSRFPGVHYSVRNLGLYWFSHSQTMSIVSFEQACIICVTFAPFVTPSPLMQSALSSKNWGVLALTSPTMLSVLGFLLQTFPSFSQYLTLLSALLMVSRG